MSAVIDRQRAPVSTRGLVEDVLDAMSLTERPYHQMNYAMPMVTMLVERVRRAADPGDRVLLIGGSSLLGECLLRAGFELEIWQFPQAATSHATARYISREITPETLGEAEFPIAAYAAIVAPFVIESMPAGDLAQFLRRIRSALTPQGALLLSTPNASALPARAAALFGKRRAVRTTGNPHTLSWPGLPVLQEYHRDDVVDAARAAGLRLTRGDYVMASRTFLELESLTIEAYAAKKALEGIRHVAPRLRDTLLLELTPRMPADASWQAGENPSVAVFVAAVNGTEQLRATLESLSQQTYRADRLEIVIVSEGASPATEEAASDFRGRSAVAVRHLHSSNAEGPETRNWAMAQVRADVSAHTDDSCFLPQDWVEAAVRQFDEDVGVVSGPVFAMGGSYPHYMEVHGVRPEPMDGKVWRDDLFPITNVFYRTSTALAAGGFHGGGLAGVGWDADLAWRVQRGGWQARFREEVCQFRRFPAPRGGWRRSQLRAAIELPGMYAAIPELGGRLSGGVFASRDTLYFDAAVAGLIMAIVKRRARWLLMGVPFLSVLSRRFDVWPPGGWKPSVRFAAKMVLLHAIWLAGLIAGSLKARRPVL